MGIIDFLTGLGPVLIVLLVAGGLFVTNAVDAERQADAAELIG